MFNYRNGRSKATDPGNGVGGFTNRSRVVQESETADPKKEALGKRIGKGIYVYAWLVQGLFIPLIYLSVLIEGSLPWLASSCVWVVVAGLPILLLGRRVANKLTVRDDARSYDAVKVYFVGLLLHFALILIFGITMKFLGL